MSKGFGSSAWSLPTSLQTAALRAGGRRRYNSVRKLRAQLRRNAVCLALAKDGWSYGVQARIARELGVSQSTICRDARAIQDEWRAGNAVP